MDLLAICLNPEIVPIIVRIFDKFRLNEFLQTIRRAKVPDRRPTGKDAGQEEREYELPRPTIRGGHAHGSVPS